MWISPIVRVSTGLLNTVDDSVIGNQEGLSGVSKFGGQLGKGLWVDADQIAQMYDSAIGTLYAGCYRYVKFKAAMGAGVRGQAVFWDNGVADNLYQVTTLETTTTLVASSVAGILLGVPTAGNYGFIQVAGIATVKYRAAIGGTLATGRPVTVCVAGGADQGLFDIVDGAGIEPIQAGWAIETPVNSALKKINMNNIFSLRG